MSEQPTPLDLQTLRRFIRAVTDLLTSEVRRKAIALLVLLLAFALSVNGLNVVSSYVGRDFMTAIAHRDMTQFVRLAILYIGLFAAMTTVAVLYRFAEERLGLVWRSWLTRRAIERYLDGRTYLQLKESAEIDNPDQRIAEDTRAFTTTTLSFTLIFLNSSLAAISFSGVLWTISPLLFVVALGYAALGTLMTILLGRPLVGLNYRQSDREADFRAALIHVRENAESIALLHHEDRLRARLLNRIDELVGNFRRITSVNRNLGVFTTGYNYLIQIIPALIVAPRFIRGEVEFGVITQSAMAFAQLLGAFSLIINQFGSISSFAAVVARLSEIVGAVERKKVDRPGIETVEAYERVAYERLTLRPLADGCLLLVDVSVSIPRGTRVLVTGPNEAAGVALFRATAGIWSHGEGRIIRPPLDAILFLPQQPYLAPGTLRHLLVRPEQEQDTSDERILAAIHEVGLDFVVQRAGGLDTEHDWPTILSLREQQQLALVRLILARPSFALLDRVSTALGPAMLRRSLQRLTASSITYINFDQAAESEPVGLYDAVLQINADGAWSWNVLGPVDPRPASGTGDVFLHSPV
jgi:vitamin B12/bleomycin/antimicrobial peptide transport system ATP-binding/permease protein